jgi:deoxyribodipyrimidine photolyase-related protein
MWPINRDQCLELLRHFVKFGLPNFGTFQDAMSEQHWALFHSRLSFALNTKMLHPLEVIKTATDAWAQNKKAISLAQIEGFVRQILGWREYMRGMYWALMPDFADLNYFEHNRALPHYYWDGQTKMNCLKQTIQQSLDKAYAHHIQRLMITGNFALLAGVHPDEVDAWYLGIYIDAIEWVEITNTRGMSQYADAGQIATKPYVSSANYIHKMSDYCQNCFYDRKKKIGERACPFNSLYWHFYDRHRDKLQKNPRIGMMYRTWERMNDSTKSEIIEQAEKYLTKIEEL